MYGTVPAYRTLAKGVSNGPDVRQLNRNLKALGYDPYDEISELDHFSTATARAIKRWQKSKGLAQTGKVELGRVVFAPSPQRVTKVDVALGQDPPGTTGATGPTGPTGTTPTTEATTPAKPSESKQAGKGSKETGKGSQEHGKSSSPGRGSKRPGSSCSPGKASKEPSKEGSTAPTSKPSGPKGNSRSGSKQPNGTNGAAPGSSEGSKNHAGDAKSPSGSKTPAAKSPGAGGEGGGGAGTLVLSTTSTQQVVQLDVKADQQQLAHIGEPAPVTLPSGRVVQGRITEVGTVASESSSGDEGKNGGGESKPGESSGNGENATIPVTLTLDQPGLPSRRGAGERRTGQEHQPQRARRPRDGADGDGRRRLCDRGPR